MRLFVIHLLQFYYEVSIILFLNRSRKVDILSYGFYGDGYVVLNSSSIKRSRSFIRFQIKTKAADGLIFLAFKDKDSFLSIELEEGSVAYKVSILFFKCI